MKTYRIHLIRHGYTEGNAQGKYIGATDLPLTTEGINQLTSQRDQGLYPDVDAVYSSPLSRCVQSAEIIYPHLSPIICQGLRECSFGEFEGKTAKELRDNPVFSRWLAGEQDVGPAGGETTADFVTRTVSAFAEIVEDLMRSGIRYSAIVAHGGTAMSLLSVCGLPQRSFSDWMCGNGRGYTLLVTPSVWLRGYKFEVIGKI